MGKKKMLSNDASGLEGIVKIFARPIDLPLSISNFETQKLHLVAADRRVYYVAKRVLDVVLAAGLLVLCLPILVLVSLAIYVYSPGPIFFVQQRVGAKRRTNGKFIIWEREDFHCYKFRTMRLDADSAIHQDYIKALIENDQEKMAALQKAATRPRGSVSQDQLIASQNAPTIPRKLVNDDRVIAPGRILRKFSIDELPQLWNVLRGDMSLVGPRPAIPYEVEMYKPWHLQRLEAQPGLTGLQQVTARCTADFDQQVQLDIEYIKKQSFWLDIKIILQTPIAVISTRGAH
jgi:lipopolysaccharide/colanic/teichoic acid biosynthesis glycosyltransferase